MAEDNFVLKAEKISKKYLNPIGAALSVLKEITFFLRRGEVLTLLGPSGSGKTTLLKILADIEKPDEGSVQFAQYPELKVNSAFIPREASSLPWLNVLENVRLGLEMEEEKNEQSAAEKLKNLIAEVGLDGYENHIPAGKSTGFRFRIALARAMASGPKAILIDSPLESLLPERKMEYYRLIRQILSKGNFSIVWSTSDVTEALLLSDRILLLNGKSGGIKEFQLEKKGIPEIASLQSETLSGIRNKIEMSLYSPSPIH